MERKPRRNIHQEAVMAALTFLKEMYRTKELMLLSRLLASTAEYRKTHPKKKVRGGK